MYSVRRREFIPEVSVEDKKALLPVFFKIWNAPKNPKHLSSTSIPFTPELLQVCNTIMLCLLLTSGDTPVAMEYPKRSDGADSVHLRKILSGA